MALPGQRNAVLRLLGDDDPSTVALVKEQLAGGSVEQLHDLRELLSAADSERASDALREIITTIESRDADARFTARCTKFGDFGDLESAAWEFASTHLPGEDFSTQMTLLDGWGKAAAARLSECRDEAAARVEILTQYLGRELRFRGNDSEYYLESNSLLPRVIQTRLGIPLSLALVYILVGQRAGIVVDGVGLPGHFLARHEDVIFDPFHGGRRVSTDECAVLLSQQKLSLMPYHLAPATPRQMLLRMLTNLRFIATQMDPHRAEKIASWERILRGD